MLNGVLNLVNRILTIEKYYVLLYSAITFVMSKGS